MIFNLVWFDGDNNCGTHFMIKYVWLYWLAVTKTLVGDLPGDLGFQSHDITSGSQGSQGRKQLDSAGSSAPGTVTR